MNPRTVGAIALRPVGNGQGSYYFLSVTTGRVLNRLHATALPMPDDVIDKLHRMARQQKNNPGLIFADRNLSLDEYDDEEDDKTYHEEDSISDDEEEALSDDEEEDDEINGNDEEAQDPPDNEDDDVDEEEEEAQGPQAEENGAAEGPPQLENDEEADNVGLMAEAEAILPAEAEQPEDLANHEAESPEVPEIYGVNEEMNDPETPGVGGAGEDEEETKEQAPTPPQRRYNLRNTRGRDYDHRYDKEDYVVDNVAMTTRGTSEVLETPQMSLKAGLRTFGKDGVRAVEKEMRQLHDRGVMMPVHRKNLSPEQQQEALVYLMFLKRKRCGKVKGRGCEDGRKQRAYIAREESTAQTVSTGAVFLAAVIDALENREVAVLDVPGAFMQADIDELVHVRF